MNLLKSQLRCLIESGYSAEDDADTRLKKSVLTLVPLIIGVAAFVWGTVYMALGHILSGSIPMSYSLISALTLSYYFKTKRTLFLEKSQLLLVLLLPFFLMWSLGGFFNGSTVMIWALFAPLAASIFLGKNNAIIWFLAYLALLLFSGLINEPLEARVEPLPELAITIFFILNMGAGSAGLYLLTSFTIHQEKSALESLHEKSEKLQLRGLELNKLNRKLKRASKEAEAGNRAKSEFLANMSHELRTPLHGILSYAQLGSDKLGTLSEEKLAKYFSQITASGTRLKVLLDDLLDLSKLEAGKMVMELSVNHLSDIVESCVAEQAALLNSRKIKIRHDYADALPELECDKNRIGQVVMNILSNAIKFSPDGGEIGIHIHPGELQNSAGEPVAALQLSLSDQGRGIPKGEDKNIFKKFIQSSYTDFASAGTGLGLAITQELVHAHQGSVWCENAITGGAIFHFLLPLHPMPVTGP